MQQRIVKSKFDFPKLEQWSSLKGLCDTKKGQGEGQGEKGQKREKGTEKGGLVWGCHPG